MNFKEAFKAMKEGNKVKLPSWGGFWYWDAEKETVMIQCRPQDADLSLIHIQMCIRDSYNILNKEPVRQNTPIRFRGYKDLENSALLYQSRGAIFYVSDLELLQSAWQCLK